MKPRTVLLIVAIVCAPFLVVCGGCIVLILVAQRTTANSTPITAEEKRVVISIQDLKDAGVVRAGSAAGETFLAEDHFDGSRELEYEYDWEGDLGSQPLILMSQVERSKTLQDAKESFPISVSAFKFGLTIAAGNNKIVEDTTHDLPGDETYAGTVNNATTSIGRIVVCRRGRVMHMIFAGPQSIDNATLGQLLQTKMDHAKAMGWE